MPYFRWAWRAAIAAWSKKQKPIGLLVSAWWPGGRIARKALSAAPDITASVAATAPPTLRITVSHVPGDIEVSPSR